MSLNKCKCARGNGTFLQELALGRWNHWGGLERTHALHLATFFNEFLYVSWSKLAALHRPNQLGGFGASQQSFDVTFARTKAYRAHANTPTEALRALRELVRIRRALTVQRFPFAGTAAHVARHDAAAAALQAIIRTELGARILHVEPTKSHRRRTQGEQRIASTRGTSVIGSRGARRRRVARRRARRDREHSRP